MVRILINGVEPVNRPIGVEQLAERFYYSQEFFAFLREITGDLTLYGQDFENLWNTFVLGGCDSLPVTIHERKGENGTWIEVFQGLIYVSDCDFDCDRRTVNVQIVDDSFVAKVLNYSDTNIELFQKRTKNGEPISITSQSIDVVDLTNSTTSGITAYTIVDLLTYLTAWITDNNVVVVSDFLSNPPYDKYYYVTGPNMRGSGISTYVKFKDVITDLCKMLNLRWAYFNGVIRLENAEYYEQSNFITADGYHDFKVSTADQFNYASFTFGSNNAVKVTYDDTAAYLKRYLAVPWGGHYDSTVTANGNCAEKRDFNLKTVATVYDANAISDCLNNTSDGTYDEGLFIVNDAADAVSVIIPNTPINNVDFFTVRSLERWLKTYCFPYPDSLSGCDSKHFSENEVLFSGLDIGFLTVDKQGCYFDGFNINGPGLFDIELYMEFFIDPIENPPGANPSLMRLAFRSFVGDFYIMPDTVNGWASGPSVGSPFVEYAERTISLNDSFIYYGYLSNVPIAIFDTLQIGITGTGTFVNAVSLSDNSYIRILNPAFNVMKDLTCKLGNFKVTAEGPLLPSKAKEIRDSRFGNILLPNKFKNFTGNIIELQRTIQTGESNITINTKNI